MTTPEPDSRPMPVDWNARGEISDAAFDDAPVGMALVALDRDGERTIRVANRALASLLGTTPEALVGITFNELTHPDDLAADDRGAARLLDGTLDVYRCRKRYRHRDGHYLWAELHARALATHIDDTVTLAHIIDISDRIELERSLAEQANEFERQVGERTTELAQSEALLRTSLEESQRQRERLEHVLEAAHASVAEWYLSDGDLDLDDSWYRRLGYEQLPLDLEDTSWHDHVHPDDWPEVLRLTERSSQAGNPMLELTFRVRHRDGSWRWNHHRGVVTEWTEDGRPKRILGIDLDVTEQRTLEQQLIHSAKMQSLGAFAGGIAHDFNNVLAIIQGHTEALERTIGDAPSPQKQRERAEAIQRAVSRATSLVRNLMLLSRPTVGGRNRVDLADYLRRSAATLPYLLGEDVRLEITVPPHPIVVAIDEGRFEAVILNLVANARDAMPAGGRLTVTLATIAGDVPTATIDVTDTGLGMDPHTLALAFEPFFTTKAPGVGTGLGLATSYTTITEARGSISVISHPGDGTTVTITLPLAVDPELQVALLPEDVGVSTHDGTILFVEDEAELLEIATDVLRDEGFRVHAALSADGALELLEQHDDIELVVTDVVMPGMSGPELATIIRRRWPSIKILFTSGYANESPTNEHFTEDQLLTKPVPADRLIRAVARALRNDGPSERD